MLIVNRLPINSNNDDEHCEALVFRENENDKNYASCKSNASFSLESTVAVQ